MGEAVRGGLTADRMLPQTFEAAGSLLSPGRQHGFVLRLGSPARVDAGDDHRKALCRLLTGNRVPVRLKEA